MNQIDELIKKINEADVIVVGGGSGMSNATGLDFWYKASPLFMKYMKYYYDKYHFEGLFNGYYTPFDSKEEKWAFMIKLLHMVYTIPPQKPTYEYLKTLLQDKPVHIITTNQDGLFKNYFPEQQVSEIQGSHYFFQSKNPTTDKHLYPAKPIVEKLLPKIVDDRLPEKYFPKSEVDSAPLTLWARGPEFLEDKRYFDEYNKITKFFAKHRGEKILFLEMGIGRMTPMFIQEPFWELTKYLPGAFYININPKDAITNPVIEDQSLLIKDDINDVLKEAAKKIKGE